MIMVEFRPDVLRWSIWKWISLYELDDLLLSVQQAIHEVQKPGIMLIVTESREPHLPVKPWLMRR